MTVERGVQSLKAFFANMGQYMDSIAGGRCSQCVGMRGRKQTARPRLLQ